MISPKIKYLDESTFLECLEQQEFNRVIIDKNINEEITLKDIEFNECKFININFKNIKLTRVDLTDCIFINCDLSNTVFDFRSITRVQFRNCKLVGISFIDTSINDIEFTIPLYLIMTLQIPYLSLYQKCFSILLVL